MKSWFNVLPLDQAVRALAAGTLPGRAACITFDDGYADNCSVALPILLKHQASATFFIATDFLDGGRMWNDTIIEAIRRHTGEAIDLEALGAGRYPTANLSAKIAAIGALITRGKYLPAAQRIKFSEEIAKSVGVTLPNDLMMSSEEVRQMKRAGMQIGAHTASHPILSRLSLQEARNEIATGKADLERILDEPMELFAYPNGRSGDDYATAHVALVRELGFTAAVSTDWGTAGRDSDLLQLPRFTPWDRGALRFGLRLAANMHRGGRAMSGDRPRG
jgi:peptidoglycan/xylan/chitin deacetylase (PgdA/CDA1 family)